MRKVLAVSALVFLMLIGRSKQALALHYGRTTSVLTINGKTLPAGSYVDIAYDGGDVWLTSRDVDAVRLPKSAVSLIPNVTFSPPLEGTLTHPTPVYRMVPALAVDPTTLHQIERTPQLSSGKGVKIISREGDDYIVAIEAPVNRYGFYYGRIPVSAVTITSGSLESGVPDPVPPLPASGLAPRAVYPGAGR